jgi:hypothetical protein
VTYPYIAGRYLKAAVRAHSLRMHVPRTEKEVEIYEELVAEQDFIIMDASDAELEDIARAMADYDSSWSHDIKELGYENQLDDLRKKRDELGGDVPRDEA